MRRFLGWWLVIVAGMLLMLGVAALVTGLAAVATRVVGPLAGWGVALLVLAALVAWWNVWVFSATPSPWFVKLVARLGDRS